MANIEQQLNEFMTKVIAKNPGEPEFHQAVKEVAESLLPFINENPKYAKAKILERMAEPERVIIFRVPWIDDKGEIQINRGFRIQMNSAIGPYKGGLRLHPTVNLGILKIASQHFLWVVVKVVQISTLKVNQTMKLCVSVKAS